MAENTSRIYTSRSKTKDFLLNKADADPANRKPVKKSLVGLEELSREFPNILTGRLFLDTAMEWIEKDPRFGVLAIRIDNFTYKSGGSSKQYAMKLLLDVAETIDDVAGESGIWGLINRKIFGCFFPKKDEKFCKNAARKIQQKLSRKRNETVTIGIALYPTIGFWRNRIFENAQKALNHASFYGPGTITVFDAVSLNISGDKLYQEGDIQGAIEEFQAALKLEPHNINVHNSLGVSYAILGQNEMALGEFESVLEIDPDNAMALYNAGLIYDLMDDTEKALEYFLHGDKLGENVFEVSLQIGKLYTQREEYQVALEHLEKAIRQNPESAAPFRYLGDCLAGLKRYKEAVQAFKKAIKYNPYDAHSISGLGYLFDAMEENPEITTTFYQHSVNLAPENGLFRFRLGLIYYKQEMLYEALEEFLYASKLGCDADEYVETIQDRLRAQAS